MEFDDGALGRLKTTPSFTCVASAINRMACRLVTATTDRIVTVGVTPSTGTAADAIS